MLTENPTPETRIDPLEFEARIPIEIKNNINLQHLVVIAEQLIEKDPSENSIVIILKTANKRTQLKAVRDLILEGCDQGIPEAGRALKMLKSWLRDPQDSDLKCILSDIDNEYDSFVRSQYILPVDSKWTASGKELSESWEKFNQSKTTLNRSEENPIEEESHDFSKKVQNKNKDYQQFEEGNIFEVEKRHKDQVGQMKKTILKLEQDLPRLLKDLIDEAPEGRLKEYFSNFLLGFDTKHWKTGEVFQHIDGISDRIQKVKNDYFPKLNTYISHDFSGDFQKGVFDPNKAANPEEYFFETLKQQKEEMFYYGVIRGILINIMQTIVSEKNNPDTKVSSEDIAWYWEKVTKILEHFNVYLNLPKVGEAFDDETQKIVGAEKNTSISDDAIVRVSEPGYAQRFENGGYLLFSKAKVIVSG